MNGNYFLTDRTDFKVIGAKLFLLSDIVKIL